MIGGLALALTAGALSAATGQGLWTPVNAAGSFFLGVQPIPAGMAGALSYLGLAVMLLVGGLLGALYATAQEPLDTLIRTILSQKSRCPSHSPSAAGHWPFLSCF